MPVKIGLVVQRFPGYGGAERYVGFLAGELARRGYGVSVISREEGRSSENYDFNLLYCRKLASLGSYEIWDKLGRYLRNGDFDVVHANSYGYYHSDISVMLKKLANYKVVFTAHGFTGMKLAGKPWTEVYGKRQRLLRDYRHLYDKLVGRWEYSLADKIIAQGKEDIDLYDRLGVDPRKVTLCYAFAEYAYFEGHPTFESKCILCIARLAAGKGLENLIRAMPIIISVETNTHLTIVGKDEGLGPYRRSIVDSLGLEASVSIVPYVPRDELVRLAKASTVLVSASLAEGFNLSIANSLALGLPVVTSNVGDSAEAVRVSGGGMILADTRPSSIADTVLRILRDDEEWESMSVRAKKYARSNLHPSKFIDTHIEVYNGLLH